MLEVLEPYLHDSLTQFAARVMVLLSFRVRLLGWDEGFDRSSMRQPLV
jgi:hypothetical protein